MRWLLGFVLLLLAIGTLRNVGCGDESPCGDCSDGNPCTRDFCDSYNTSGTISCDPEDIAYRCEHAPHPDGTPCGGTNVCVDGVCAKYDGTLPCTEQGIRLAIALGGGPHTLECNGPTTVVTRSQIEIDNDVILDGEDNLVVDASGGHRVFLVAAGITAELRGVTVARGVGHPHSPGAGIRNEGTLTLIHTSVSGSTASWGDTGSVHNIEGGFLTLENSNVSKNATTGIHNEGMLTLINTTVSGNSAGHGGGIYNSGMLTLINTTVSGNSADHDIGGIYNIGLGAISSFASIVAHNYDDAGLSNCTMSAMFSFGYNLESPGDTCGFDQPTDQVNVSADDLMLGPLQDNGGPTETHALLPGSVAIDVIPEADCVDADGGPLTTDQRGFPRDSMCDVGSVEVQP